MYEPPSLPPAGWYPDPERAGAMRWWDGTAWAAPTPVHSTWRADALPDFGALLGGGFGVLGARWRALLTIAAVTAVPSALLVKFALYRLARGVRIVDDELVGWTSDRLPIVIASGAVAIALSGLGSIAGWWLTLQTIDEPNGDVARSTSDEVGAGTAAIAAALRIVPRAVGWGLVTIGVALVALAIVAAASIVSIGLGVILFVVLMPALFYVAIRFAFVGQALADRPGTPFGRSAAVSRERFWATFGRIFVVGIIAAMIGFAINSVTAAIGAAGGGPAGLAGTFQVDERGELDDIDFEEAVAPNAANVAGTVLGALAGVVTTGFTGGAYALMYRSRNPRDRA